MKRWKRITALIVALVMAMSALPVTAVAEEQAAEAGGDFWGEETLKDISITYRVRGNEFRGAETARISYHPWLFLQNASDLSPELAKIGAALSAASYGPNLDGDNWDSSYLYGALKNMGFTTDDKYKSTFSRDLTIWDNHYVGYTIAEKTVTWQEEAYTVYCVPIRGTYGNAEWYSNFEIGTVDTHAGFHEAA